MSDRKNRKSKRPFLDIKLRLKLWTNAGGRCQYRGCNKLLNIDEIRNTDLNKSYIAHIYAFAEKGPRYDKTLSRALEKDFSNLMLMCDECHRRIDKEDVDGHPASLLIDMKKGHESRIKSLTSIKENVKTNIITYTSRIGKFEPNIEHDSIRELLAKNGLYPLAEIIEIGMTNSSLEDDDELYWQSQDKSLVDNFERKAVKHFGNTGNNHFSLFALAPQPLLIRLGTLIPDLYAVDVYQKHREPDTWEWQKGDGNFSGFVVKEPFDVGGLPVLNVSLSASIVDERIKEVIDEKLSIWKLTIDTPKVSFLTHQEILEDFRGAVRTLLNRIKEVHGHEAMLRVFPCMPNSACVEFGRVWMPKADLTMEIYDERDGFKKALRINRK